MAETPIIPPSIPVQAGPAVVNNQGRNPPPLPELPAGNTLSGTVTGFDAKSNPQILTDALQLVLKTNYPVQKGSHVVLRLEQALRPDVLPAMRIVAVDGKPVLTPPTNAPVNSALQNNMAEIAKPVGVLLDAVSRPVDEQGRVLPQQQTVAKSEVALPQPREVATQVDVKGDAARLPAQLLKLAAEPLASPHLLSVLQKAIAALPQTTAAPRAIQVTPENLVQWVKPGMLMQFKLVNVVLPQAQAALPLLPPTDAAETSRVPLPQAQTGYSAYAKVAPPAGVVLPSTAPVPAAIPPASAQPAAPASAQPQGNAAVSPAQVGQLLLQAQAQISVPNQLAAVVLGQEKSGVLVIQTQLGTFSLPPSAVATTASGLLPAGSVLQVEVQSVKLAQAMQTRGLPPALAGAGAFNTASQLTSDWSALNELVTIVQSMPSNVAADAMQRIVPNIGNNLTAGMVFFLSIIRKGEVDDWLGGDVMGRLRQMGRGDLIERLGGDLAALRSVWTEGLPQQQQQTSTNWQAFFFPVMVDKNLHTARIFVKPEDEDKKKQGGSGTRFVVELDLSALGPMQLDGLIKKREMRSYFDLVVRTLSDLPNDIQSDILSIFERSQAATGMGGSIYFRKEVEFPVNPLEEIASGGKSTDHGSIMA